MTRLAEFRKFRESVKDLPPAERETKLREWREKNLGAGLRPGRMAPEEREAARTNFSARIEAQIKALKQKETGGALTEQETRRLQRLEQMARRLETRGTGGGPGLPTPRPPGEKGGAKPVPPADVK